MIFMMVHIVGRGNIKMKENIIWWILGIIVGYLVLSDGSQLSETINFIISKNLFIFMLIIIIGAVIIQKWQK